MEDRTGRNGKNYRKKSNHMFIPYEWYKSASEDEWQSPLLSKCQFRYDRKVDTEEIVKLRLNDHLFYHPIYKIETAHSIFRNSRIFPFLGVKSEI